jgi:hypothetical protein
MKNLQLNIPEREFTLSHSYLSLSSSRKKNKKKLKRDPQ